MTLRELFDLFRLDARVFCQKVRCSAPNIYLILKGAKPRRKLAERIEKFTNGLVTVLELRGEEHRRENKASLKVRERKALLPPAPVYTQEQKLEMFKKKITKKMVLPDERKKPTKIRLRDHVRSLRDEGHVTQFRSPRYPKRQIILSATKKQTYTNLLKRHRELSAKE